MAVDILAWCQKNLPNGRPTSSGWYRASCPFHNETTPSFAANLQTGSWGCKSASCGKHGGFARLVAQVEGIPWHEAYKRLGVPSPFNVDESPPDISPDRASRLTINPLPPGLVPVSPDRVPPFLGHRGYSHEDAQAFGLCFGADSAAKRLRNFLVFPFWTLGGEYKTYTARRMSTEKGMRYLQPEQGLASQMLYGVWRFAGLQSVKRFFVCEGPFDVMRMWKLGLPAVGISTTAATASQRWQISELAEQFGADVVVLLDNGENEDRMSHSLAVQLNTVGTRVHSGHLPDGIKDPDGLTPEAVLKLLDTCERAEYGSS